MKLEETIIDFESPSKLVGLWLLESKVQIPVPVWQENKSDTK